jgi:hypothetical protein
MRLPFSAMELELRPDQPAPVVEAVVALLEAPASVPDPWWQAGIDETLERQLGP